jgi:hypothetical protein
MILTASRDKTIIMWTLTRDEVGLLCIAERMEVSQRITVQREPLEKEQNVSREPGQERRLGGSCTTLSCRGIAAQILGAASVLDQDVDLRKLTLSCS